MLIKIKPTAFLLILLIPISFFGCTNSKPKKILSEKERREEIAKIELSDNSEKITLLSIIKNISYDSLSFILTDYYSSTSMTNLSSDSTRFYSEQAILNISKKYHKSKKRIAALIFSFKYEMLTKEEIADEELEKRESEQQEPPEDPY